MADDDDEYDPDVGVPVWLNVLVPVLSAVVFVLVLLFLYRTTLEVSVSTIERWISKLPFRQSATGKSAGSVESANKPNTPTNPEVHEHVSSPIVQYNSGYTQDASSVRSYGAISDPETVTFQETR